MQECLGLKPWLLAEKFGFIKQIEKGRLYCSLGSWTQKASEHCKFTEGLKLYSALRDQLDCGILKARDS